MRFENYKQKITEKELIEIEELINKKLPDAYKKVISEYNGGYPEKEYFRGTEIYFLPIKYGEYTLEMNIKNTKDYYPKNFLPFAEYGGTSYCISLNNDENYGKIYWVDEGGESELVCNSFEEFMNELSDNEDY